jgi:hypothetical protein
MELEGLLPLVGHFKLLEQMLGLLVTFKLYGCLESHGCVPKPFECLTKLVSK